MTIHDYSGISTKQNVKQVTSRVLKTYGAETASFIFSHDYSGGSLEPGNEQIDASPVQIHGSSSTTAPDLVIARSLTEHIVALRFGI